MVEDIQRVFIVKAEIACDIYKLYLKNSNKVIQEHATAFIPSFKTSVLMNRLFRNIRENQNLDLLEESEDEDEFENIDLNKFVNTEKQIKMKCKFSHKFKSWIPIEALENSEVSLLKDIQMIEKKYR